MIEKTVIILGAGASKDYGFPVGNALIKNILNNEENGFCTYRDTNELGTQNRIFDFKDLEQLLNEMSSSADEKSSIENMITRSGDGYLRMNQFELIRKFISGLKLYRNSQIDYFLRTFSKYEKLGKIMISRELLKQEAVAKDKIERGNFRKGDPNQKGEQDWIGSLFANLIQKAKKPEDLKTISDNLTIVTFNYDLLLEHYLNEFCQGDDEWGKALEEFKKNLKIIHIYGKLGRFEWESEKNLKEIYGEEVFKTFALRENSDHFGFLNGKYDYEKIRDLSEGIKVIGGNKHQEDLLHIKKARSALYQTECKKIFFFGFGFDKNNLVDCLQTSRDKFKGKSVYCTIYDENDEEKIKISVDEHIKNLRHLSGLESSDNINALFEYGKFQTAQQISSLLLYI
ncbi:MAG: SIR2 family protein [Rickettsiales bacterium]|nr:SIR2 family protein [Rickettsiales bacterium]